MKMKQKKVDEEFTKFLDDSLNQTLDKIWEEYHQGRMGKAGIVKIRIKYGDDDPTFKGMEISYLVDNEGVTYTVKPWGMA